jgi:hypothetical protein
MEKFNVMAKLTILIPSTKVAKVKTCAMSNQKTLMVCIVHLTLLPIIVPRLVPHMKSCAHRMTLFLDAKVRTNVKLGQQTTWMNIAQVLRIVLFIAITMNLTVQQALVQMAANCPIAARRKKEGLMENCAHSIAQNYVKMTKCSVLEDSRRQDVEDQALVGTKMYTYGEKELTLAHQHSAQDTVQDNVKPMKYCALHS